MQAASGAGFGNLSTKAEATLGLSGPLASVVDPGGLSPSSWVLRAVVVSEVPPLSAPGTQDAESRWRYGRARRAEEGLGGHHLALRRFPRNPCPGFRADCLKSFLNLNFPLCGIFPPSSVGFKTLPVPLLFIIYQINLKMYVIAGKKKNN